MGWQKICLNSARRTVRFLSPGIELDPGGVGKGYAVTCAVRILLAKQVGAALLSAGSSTIYALGAPPGEAGWKIRVPSARQEESTISTIVLRDTSLSTANRSEKNFTHDGHLYGAIMDPRTLRPVEGMLQVTVISPLATDSDALSNALFILGPEDSARVVGTTATGLRSGHSRRSTWGTTRGHSLACRSCQLAPRRTGGCEEK